MKMHIWLAGMVLGLTLFPWGTACASKLQPLVKADTKADFMVVVAAVKKEMVPGGRYEFVSSSERQTIDASLGEMQSLFDRFGTVAAMDKDAKFQLYVDQENVGAILTHRDDRRMVCKSERPIGSLLPQRTCQTYGEVERGRQKSEQFMEQQARPGFVSGSANPSAKGGMPIPRGH
ncbi:MAG TPA: hypothetical protein VIO59_08720 [Rhodanobacter sp.]